MKLTEEQQNFVDAVCDSGRSVALEAYAGTGKTSTILAAVDALREKRPESSITVCAYNKAIADEVSAKLKKRGHTDWKMVSASTMHSMGFGIVRGVFDNVEVNPNKVRDIIDNLGYYVAYSQHVGNLVRVAKQEGFGFFDNRGIGDINAWYDVAAHYDINGFDDTSDLDKVIEEAQKVYRLSLEQTNVIDYDDMILWPLVKNLAVRYTRDVIFVDEAQDLSRSRQALIAKFLSNDGQMIVVGDRHQAIYGFSGADDVAMDNMIRQFDCMTMPLSVSWRCPVNVIAKAQTIVPGIQHAPDANAGAVKEIDNLPKELGPETAILCRNTAPLIGMAYQLIRGGTAVKVEGRDIGKGLAVMCRRWKVKSVDVFLDRLDNYERREVQKAKAKGDDAKVAAIEDKVETLKVIADECLRQGRNQVSDMVQFIEDLFADGAKDCTVLATYHRSKGREWDRVILLKHKDFCPSKWAKQDWQLKQEHNLAYVAFTRAMKELLFFGM